jgi:hypothetical protein
VSSIKTLGARVALETELSLLPHTVLACGERGTVQEEGNVFGVASVTVLMDLPHKGLMQWANCALICGDDLNALRLLTESRTSRNVVHSPALT